MMDTMTNVTSADLDSHEYQINYAAWLITAGSENTAERGKGKYAAMTKVNRAAVDRRVHEILDAYREAQEMVALEQHPANRKV